MFLGIQFDNKTTSTVRTFTYASDFNHFVLLSIGMFTSSPRFQKSTPVAFVVILHDGPVLGQQQ